MNALRSAAWPWLLVSAGVALSSCGSECIDKFDCTAKQRAGETLTCDLGKCVAVMGLTPNLPNLGGAGGSGGTGGSAGAGGGVRPDAGSLDGGRDGGGLDAGRPDAGVTDAGTADAGTNDAGTNDAGTTDAGMDAGAADFTDAGQFEGHLSAAQLVPPGSDIGTGLASLSLLAAADGGRTLRWRVTHPFDAGLVTHGVLGWATLSGEAFAMTVILDGGWDSPAHGEQPLDSLPAAFLESESAALELRAAAGALVRGQLVPLGHRVSSVALLGADGGQRGVVQFVAPVSQGVRTAGSVRFRGTWTEPMASGAQLVARPADGGAERAVTPLLVTASGLSVLGSFVDDGGAFVEPTAVIVSAPDGGLEGPVVHH